MVAAFNLEDDATRITVVVDGEDVPVFESLGELRQWAAEHPGAEFVRITYVSRDNSGVESSQSMGGAVTVDDDGRQVTVVVVSSLEPLGTLMATLNNRAISLGRDLVVDDAQFPAAHIHGAGLTPEGIDELREAALRADRGEVDD